MMDEKTRQDHEWAAVAFESRSMPGSKPDAEWKQLYWRAWHVCNDAEPGPASIYEIDDRAARLLRDCIEKGEVLK